MIRGVLAFELVAIDVLRTQRAQPVLDGAERHADRVGEIGEGHVAVALAQLEHEATPCVAVAPPLAFEPHAAGVAHQEAQRLAL